MSMASWKTEQLFQNPYNIASKIEIAHCPFLPFDLSLIQRFYRIFDHKKGQIIVTQLAKVFKCIGLSKAQLGTFNICPSADDVIWRRLFLISYILKMTSRILKKEIEKRCSPYWVAKGSTALLNWPTHPAQTLVNHLTKNTMANVK